MSTTENFYDKNLKSRPASVAGKRERFDDLLERVRLKEAEFKAKRLVDEYPSSIENFRCWRVFDRQEDAFAAVFDSRRHDLHVFSFESAELTEEGRRRRKFLVTSYDEFWHTYRQIGDDRRHFYEIIPEGAACKMYFDLEFDAGANPGKSGASAMKTFMDLLVWFVEKKLVIACERRDFLDLDSSTPEKFSHHVIMASKNSVVFRDNRHLGVFVGDFLRAVDAERASRPEDRTCPMSMRSRLDDLFCVDKRGEAETSIVDAAVYTRNRAFRIFLSSKAAKKTPLLVAEGCEFEGNEIVVDTDQDVFLASLICNVVHRDGMKVVSFDDVTGKIRPRGESSSNSLTSSSPSPYPSVDDYVTNHVIRDANVIGAIRRSVFFAESKIILYDVKDYRFCRRVGRHHSSNNIQIVVDVVRHIWYQRCLDPDCRHFRSNEFPFPATCVVSVEKGDRPELSEFDLDDEALLRRVVELEDRKAFDAELEEFFRDSDEGFDSAMGDCGPFVKEKDLDVDRTYSQINAKASAFEDIRSFYARSQSDDLLRRAVEKMERIGEETSSPQFGNNQFDDVDDEEIFRITKKF